MSWSLPVVAEQSDRRKSCRKEQRAILLSKPGIPATMLFDEQWRSDHHQSTLSLHHSLCSVGGFAIWLQQTLLTFWGGQKQGSALTWSWQQLAIHLSSSTGDKRRLQRRWFVGCLPGSGGIVLRSVPAVKRKDAPWSFRANREQAHCHCCWTLVCRSLFCG